MGDNRLMDKNFIYYPSLSAGSMVSAFKKNTKFEDGTTCRFFSKEYPEEWRHPYFLITAGHHFKKMDFRDQLGLDDEVLVFGDSGGFQIATGALKWDGTIRERIFEWLEHNSDVAANLDIPPRAKYENRFAESMDISFDNFKYFESKQTGKTDFLNVIQGTYHEEYAQWYHKFKDFAFNGWCIGGPKKLVDFMYVIALMLKEKEFEKKHVKYIHLLGISKISDFFILATLQKLINKLTDNRVLFSTDSSSPGQYPVFGTYLHSGNFKTQTFTELYFPKNNEYRRKSHASRANKTVAIDTSRKVPCCLGCPACKDFTYDYLGGQTAKGLDRYSQEGMPRMVIHNTHLYVDIAKDVSQLVNNHVELLETAIPKDLNDVILSLHAMFDDPDNAMNVYATYKKTYKKFGGDSISTTDANQFNKFFKT